MKALITGGRGYIGENLAGMLEDPIVYDIVDGNDITGTGYGQLCVEMYRADVCFHLAAVSGIQVCEEDPMLAINTNILGTLNVARIAKFHNTPMVFASSFAALNPTNIYAMTKYLGEKIVLEYGGRIVRIANVYGGSNYLAKKNSAVAALMKGTWEERGLGEETRDFVHVEDVCRVMIEASKSPHGSIVVEASSGTKISINRLIELSKSPIFPDNLRRLGGESN